MKITIIFLLLTVMSFNGFSQHDHGTHSEQKQTAQQPDFKDKKMGAAYRHYIDLKNALVDADRTQASKSAAELQKALSVISEGKKATAAVSEILAATDLEAQRKAFSTISNEMSMLVKNSGLSSGSLYIQYCPMANGSKGGYWLSNEKAIMNPYFGDKMLHCGTVKETVQ